MKVLRNVARVIFGTVVFATLHAAKAQIPPSITTQPQNQVADFAGDAGSKLCGELG
jgi:hypothetical protein